MIEALKTAIDLAVTNLGPHVRKTPLMPSPTLSQKCGNQVYLKLENMQTTGAFKLRGALNKILSLCEDTRSQGVICASAGNHAQGVAFGAALTGCHATVVMPNTTPAVKVEATKRLGAQVILKGDTFEEAYDYSLQLAALNHYTMVHPYDDLDVMAGQGTIANEILDQLPDCDMLLVPVGGGGLLAGTVALAKSRNPNLEVYGVEPIGAASMFKSFYSRQLSSLNTVNTKAEGAAVKTPGRMTFDVVSKLCDGMIVVSEEAIVEAVWDLMKDDKVVAEYAGALTVAALRTIQPQGKKVCCLVSGGNIDATRLLNVIPSNPLPLMREEVQHYERTHP